MCTSSSTTTIRVGVQDQRPPNGLEVVFPGREPVRDEQGTNPQNLSRDREFGRQRGISQSAARPTTGDSGFCVGYGHDHPTRGSGSLCACSTSKVGGQEEEGGSNHQQSRRAAKKKKVAATARATPAPSRPAQRATTREPQEAARVTTLPEELLREAAAKAAEKRQAERPPVKLGPEEELQ